MVSLLAYAQAADDQAAIQTVVICLCILLIAFFLALVPMQIARIRRPGRAHAVIIAAFVWALITSGSVAATTMKQLTWNREYTERISTGYFDPQDQTDAPVLPWAIWGILAAAYMGLVIWPLTLPRTPVETSRRGFDVVVRPEDRAPGESER